MRSKGLAVFAAAALLLACAPARAAGVIDPALTFRTLTTAHFVVYFHQGENSTALRLAAIAEDTWRALRQPLVVKPPPRTHVVLVDQTELANGLASPVPYDTIFITATWPAGSDFIGFTDDWLRLVFTHEYTHILHLDRSEGWARAVRGIFGRVPLAYPNLFLPIWQIEGLAVYEESMVTGEGRLHAGDFRAVEQTARREHSLEPLDRVNGGLTDWPAGTAPYAYGAAFQQYLADRYGPDTLAALAEQTARSLPYFGSLAFEKVYGKSLGALWKDFEAQPPEVSPAPAVDDNATRITPHGFTVSGPRFAVPLCETCPAEVVYALVTPDAFPSFNAVNADGTHDHVLATRYLGSTSGTSRDVLVFDQQEYRRNAGLYSDLYVLDRKTGSTRAITNGARLLDPDLSPDGTRIVCVQDGNGQRNLVVRSRDPEASSMTLLAEPDTQFDAPRWSPDGASIVVARHRLGGQSEIVVVDAGTAAVRVVASDPVVRFVTPTWKPDGSAILASADYDGSVFNVYEFDLTGSRGPAQITHTLGGATWPDVSPDGRTIVFAGYTKDGYDVFSMAYPSTPPAGSALRAPAPSSPHAPLAVAGLASVPYSPWPTLRPTSWMPYIDDRADQIRFGAAVSGYDVLGYHGYSLSATWLVDGPDGAIHSSGATPDWQAAYAYGRWRPTFFISASRATSFYAGPPTDAGTPTNTTSREYHLEGGVEVPFVHARAWHVLYASALRSANMYYFPDGSASVNLTALRGGWETSTAHTYGYSISPEGGVTVGSTIESVRRALGSYADSTTATADVRAYLPGFAAHHVLAIRLGGGASSGNEIAGRTFLAGGGAPAPPPLNFDSRAFELLRGFGEDTFAGSHIAVLNTEYRLPLARPQRGHGTFPLFLSAVHAAAFADAGNAWTRTFRGSDLKTSAGLELSADVVLGYSLPLTATLGGGWGHDGAHIVSDGGTIYVRLGRSF